jgi:hypothetical protein
MYRFLLMALLLLAMPALAAAQEDKEKGKNATKDGAKEGAVDKKDDKGDSDEPQPGWYKREPSTWLRVVEVSLKIAAIAPVVLLTLIALLLFGLRSDIGQLLEKMDKGGPS